MHDEDIVNMLFERSEWALTILRKKYSSLCTSIAGKLLQDAQDVEEVVNDVFLDVWDSIPPQRPQNLSAYMASTTRRRALTRLRQSSTRKRRGMEVNLEELEGILSSGDDPALRMEQTELAACVQRFLLRESEEDRNIFLRRYWFFDSVEDISKRFAISHSKVKSKLFRIRNRLREYMIQEGLLHERV